MRPRLVPRRDEPRELIPEIQPTRKATRRTLAKIQQNVLLENAEASLKESFRMLRIKIRHGDLAAVKMCFEVNSMIRAPGGVTVNASINQQNNSTVDNSKVFSFEGLVRRLDSRTQQPTTISVAELSAHDEAE